MTWFAQHSCHQQVLPAAFCSTLSLQFFCSCFFYSLQAACHKPSRAHDLLVLPMCTRLPLSSHCLCCGNSLLSHQRSCSRVHRKLITSATKAASAGRADAVQAEFTKAGISAEVTLKVLRQYKPYLNWDIETKLRPALQSWLQEVGTEQLSKQLQRLPSLLLCMPEERIGVYSWLVSKAARVQQKAPRGTSGQCRAPLRLFSKQLPSRMHRCARFYTNTLSLLHMDQNMLWGRFRL